MAKNSYNFFVSFLFFFFYGLDAVMSLTFPRWTWQPVSAPTSAGLVAAGQRGRRGWGHRGVTAAGTLWQTAAELPDLSEMTPADWRKLCRTGTPQSWASLRGENKDQSVSSHLESWPSFHKQLSALSNRISYRPHSTLCFYNIFIYIHQLPAEWPTCKFTSLSSVWKMGKLVWLWLGCFCHLSPSSGRQGWELIKVFWNN